MLSERATEGKTTSEGRASEGRRAHGMRASDVRESDAWRGVRERASEGQRFFTFGGLRLWQRKHARSSTLILSKYDRLF